MNVGGKKDVVSAQFQNSKKNVKFTQRKAVLSVPPLLRGS